MSYIIVLIMVVMISYYADKFMNHVKKKSEIFLPKDNTVNRQDNHNITQIDRDYFIKKYGENFFTDLYPEERCFDDKYCKYIIDKCTKILEENPNDYEAIVERSIVYSHQDKPDYKLAYDELTKAININPDNYVAYAVRGESSYLLLEKYISMEDTERNMWRESEILIRNNAIQDLSKAIELNPHEVKCYYIRGTMYYDYEQYEECVQDLTKGKELDPNCRQSERVWCLKDSVYRLRGESYLHIGEYEKALYDFTKARELCNDGTDEILEMFIQRALEGIERNLPISDNSKLTAINLDENTVKQIINMDSNTYYNMTPQERLNFLTKTIEVTPENKDLYLLRASVYLNDCLRLRDEIENFRKNFSPENISNGLLHTEYLANIINVMKNYKNMVTLVIEDALKSQKEDLIRITEGLKQECLYIDELLERVEKLGNHIGNVSAEALTNPADDTPTTGRKIDI